MDNYNLKIYIISDDIPLTHKEFKKKWICDVLKEEFSNYFDLNTTTDANEADIPVCLGSTPCKLAVAV